MKCLKESQQYPRTRGMQVFFLKLWKENETYATQEVTRSGKTGGEEGTYLYIYVQNHFHSYLLVQVFFLGPRIKFPASFLANLNLIFVQNPPLPYMKRDIWITMKTLIGAKKCTWKKKQVSIIQETISKSYNFIIEVWEFLNVIVLSLEGQL